MFDKPLDYSEYFKRVVEWNAIARNGEHDFSEKAMKFQLSLVKEEAEELEIAYVNNDKVEALDALCDTFVTASYLYFQEFADKNWEPEIKITVPSSSIDYTKQMKYSYDALESGHLTLKDVCALLYQFDGCITKALTEVLDSNTSKFPELVIKKGIEGFKVKSKFYPAKDECKAIEERSEGRYKGVSYSVVESNGVKYLVFKSDKGKYVKACSFFEPNLSQFC